MDRDARDLRRLALAHYAVGVLTALMAIPFIQAIVKGVDWFHRPGPYSDLLAQLSDLDVPPELIEQMVVFLLASIALMILLHAAVIAWLGWCLARARRYWLIFIFSLLDCTYLPFGTVIGIWAVVVLSRPGVKIRFGLKQPVSRQAVESNGGGNDASCPPGSTPATGT